MKFCPNCGTKIEDQKAEYPNCGFKSSDLTREANMDDINADEVETEPKSDESQNKNPLKGNNKVVYAKRKVEKYDYYENRSYDEYNYDSYVYVNAEEAVDIQEEPSLAAKILLIVMVIFSNVVGAVVGLIIGGVFVFRNGKGYKSYGKKLIITSVVFLVLDILVWWLIFGVFSNML